MLTARVMETTDENSLHAARTRTLNRFQIHHGTSGFALLDYSFLVAMLCAVGDAQCNTSELS